MNSDPNKPSLRKHFARSLLPESRRVEASEIERIARDGGRIDLRYAVITEPLNLASGNFAGALSFLGCDFKERI